MKKKFKLFKIIENNKNKKLIYIVLGLFALLLVVLLLFILFRNKNNIYDYYDEKNSNIVVTNTYKEKPGTFIRSLSSLKKEHCIDDVCIKNVVIYYIKDKGRIEYEIINNSKKKVSGAFKLKFDNGNTTYVVYSKLKKGESREGIIAFSDVDYSNVYDYSLKKLKDDEFKKLLNTKK